MKMLILLICMALLGVGGLVLVDHYTSDDVSPNANQASSSSNKSNGLKPLPPPAN